MSKPPSFENLLVPHARDLSELEEFASSAGLLKCTMHVYHHEPLTAHSDSDMPLAVMAKRLPLTPVYVKEGDGHVIHGMCNPFQISRINPVIFDGYASTDLDGRWAGTRGGDVLVHCYARQVFGKQLLCKTYAGLFRTDPVSRKIFDPSIRYAVHSGELAIHDVAEFLEQQGLEATTSLDLPSDSCVYLRISRSRTVGEVGRYDEQYFNALCARVSNPAKPEELLAATLNWHRQANLPIGLDPVDDFSEGGPDARHGLIVTRGGNDIDTTIETIDNRIQLIAPVIRLDFASNRSLTIEPTAFLHSISFDSGVVTGKKILSDIHDWGIRSSSVASRREVLGASFRGDVIASISVEALDVEQLAERPIRYNIPVAFPLCSVVAGKGTGKSALTRALRYLGMKVIDSDELWERRNVYKELVEEVKDYWDDTFDIQALVNGSGSDERWLDAWNGVYVRYLRELYATVLEICDERGYEETDRCVIMLHSWSEVCIGRIIGPHYLLETPAGHDPVQAVMNRTTRNLTTPEEKQLLVDRYGLDDSVKILYLEVFLATVTNGLNTFGCAYDSCGTIGDLVRRLSVLWDYPVGINRTDSKSTTEVPDVTKPDREGLMTDVATTVMNHFGTG